MSPQWLQPRAYINEKPDPTGGTYRRVDWCRHAGFKNIALYTEDQVREMVADALKKEADARSQRT